MRRNPLARLTRRPILTIFVHLLGAAPSLDTGAVTVGRSNSEVRMAL